MTHGVRIGNETHTRIAADVVLRPLRDQIIVEPREWKPSAVLTVIYQGKPLRGTVKAVGPGCFPKRYDGPKGKRSKTWDSKAFRPTELIVGDLVEFGGLELRGYLFQTFLWGDIEHVICREEDIALVCDDTEIAA
jgi:co-chaperonin GroES (HSP10)